MHWTTWKIQGELRRFERKPFVVGYRPYSNSSLALNVWKFNLSFSWVSMLFLNSCKVSSHIVRYDTNPPVIQKQHCHWYSREAQIELPLIECEWAFRVRVIANDEGLSLETTKLSLYFEAPINPNSTFLIKWLR
jgi:hypothetical protein